jgi:hypothetical protein
MNLLNSPPINIKIEFANLPDDITYKLILLLNSCISFLIILNALGLTKLIYFFYSKYHKSLIVQNRYVQV